MLLKHEKGR